MDTQRWTLVDVEADAYLPDRTFEQADFPGADSPVRVVKRTLRGGLREGVEAIEIDNGRASFTVLPSRGLGLWKGRVGGIELGWKSPVRGPVHPHFVPLDAPDGLGWLRGFDELLVRCGLESNGPPQFDQQNRLTQPLHGRIANLPAHKVVLEWTAETRTLRLIGEIEETRLFGQKLRLTVTYETVLGRPGLTLRDEVKNLSAQSAELELLYHINIGAPFLSAGAEVLVPFRKLVPKTHHAASEIKRWNTYPAPQTHVPEAVYYFQPLPGPDGDTQALLINAAKDGAVSVKFPVEQLPWFILWKNPLQVADGYVTGLEPAINFPNPKTYESQQGRVLTLPAGTSYRCRIDLDAHEGSAAVETAAAAIGELMSGPQPEVYDFPLPGWTVG